MSEQHKYRVSYNYTFIKTDGIEGYCTEVKEFNGSQMKQAVAFVECLFKSDLNLEEVTVKKYKNIVRKSAFRLNEFYNYVRTT